MTLILNNLPERYNLIKEQFIKELPSILFRELHDCIEFKKLVRFEIYLKDIPGLIKQIHQLNLSHSVSNTSFQVVVDTNMDDWSSSLINCSDTNINVMRFVYIHPDIEVCWKAKILDSIDDDLGLGLLLNYPKCCVEAYLNWQKNNEDIDPITTLTNSFSFTGQISNFDFPNPFSRYFGAGLYSHFPCSFHCKRTKDIAKNSLEKLQINFPSVADRLSKFENSLVIFNKEKGVCLWTNYDKAKSKIFLDKKNFHGQGELKKVFERIEEIGVTEKELTLTSPFKETTTFKMDNSFIATFNTTNAQKIHS